jgi:hypothetical protein
VDAARRGRHQERSVISPVSKIATCNLTDRVIEVAAFSRHLSIRQLRSSGAPGLSLSPARSGLSRRCRSDSWSPKVYRRMSPTLRPIYGAAEVYVKPGFSQKQIKLSGQDVSGMVIIEPGSTNRKLFSTPGHGFPPNLSLSCQRLFLNGGKMFNCPNCHYVGSLS